MLQSYSHQDDFEEFDPWKRYSVNDLKHEDQEDMIYKSMSPPLSPRSAPHEGFVYPQQSSSSSTAGVPVSSPVYVNDIWEIHDKGPGNVLFNVS